MSDDELTEEQGTEQTEEQTAAAPNNIINPDDFKAPGGGAESTGEAVKPEQPAAAAETATGDKSGQYSDHEIAKLVNRITPALINNFILSCPECDKLTPEEVENSGIGAAMAWYVDKKLPSIPIDTPEFAILTAAGALMGYTALHHPVIKSKLEAIEKTDNPNTDGNGFNKPAIPDTEA